MTAKQLLCFLLVVTVPAMGQTTQDGTVQKMPAEIPESVQKLLIWPTSDIIARKSVSVTTTNVQGAIMYAESWVRGTIDGKWQPAKLEPLCVSWEFEDRDVVRFKWTTEGRSFMIAQTAHIFVVQVSPAPDVQLDKIRGVALDVFVKTGRRWTGQGERVQIPELNRVIAESSFDARPVKRITLQDTNTTVLVGIPQTLLDSLTRKLLQKTPQNGDQPESFVPGGYWFENVRWFADDTRVAFYFYKEDGPTASMPSASAESTWFK